MRSIQNYIISTQNRYNNKININKKELILNTEINERDHIFVNRIATVKSIPLDIKSPIQIGDEIIVHHNVFRKWIDVRGEEQNSRNFLSEDTYSEYEFTIENQKLYRILSNHITINYGSQRKSNFSS